MRTLPPAHKAPVGTAAFEVEGRASLLTLSRAERRFRSIWHVSTFRAFANLLKTMVGAGVLTLPRATMQFGLLASAVGVTVAGYLSAAAILLAVKCNSKVRDAEGERPAPAEGEEEKRGDDDGTWTRIARASYGRSGVALVASAILIAQLGVCAAYFDFVTSTLVDHGNLTHLRAVAVTWVLMTGVSMPRELKSVAVLSMAGLLTYVYVLVLLASFASEALDCSAGPPNATMNSIECALLAEQFAGTAPICHAGVRRQPTLVRMGGFGAWFGPAIFAFEGLGTALGIYDAIVVSAHERAPAGTRSEGVRCAADASFRAVVYAAYSCGVVLYIAVGSIGYLGMRLRAPCNPLPAAAYPLSAQTRLRVALLPAAGWGELVPGTVLDAFPHGAVRDSGEDVLAVVLGLTFALQMNPVWGLLEPALLRRDGCRLAWPLLRGGVVGLIAFGCWLVPKVEGMVAISGSIGFSFIGFILPGLFYLRLFAPVPGIPTSSAASGGWDEPRPRWWERTNAAARRIPRAPTRDTLLGRPASCLESFDRAVALVLVGVGATGSVLGVASIFQASDDPLLLLPFPDC